MSAPAMNDLSPAPVITTTRTAGSCAHASSVERTASRTALLSAFRRSARLMVSVATRSATSVRMTASAVIGFEENCPAILCQDAEDDAPVRLYAFGRREPGVLWR